ncbi:MAG: hypothetical protein IV097_10410 [Burkholderiaceae bacterium]|nr:hypothetical protein [Burkholderiaceae bacterium]
MSAAHGPASAETQGMRRSALLLHSVGADDQAWLLDRLADQQQSALRGLLGELKQLGIPRQPELLHEALPVAKAASPAPVDPGDMLIHSLSALSLDRVEELLRGEPADLIARLLALAPWPWEAALMQRIPALKQRDIDEHLPSWTAEYAGSRAPRRVDQALLRALLQRADEVPATSPGRRTAAAAGFGSRAGTWLAHLLKRGGRP